MSETKILEHNTFTEKEFDDIAKLMTITVKNVCLYADKYGFDRDKVFKYFSVRLDALADISTVKGFKV